MIKKSKYAIVISSVLLICLAFTGILLFQNTSKGVIKISSSGLYPSDENITINNYKAEVSKEEIIQASSLVVNGEIVGIPKTLKIAPVGGGDPSVFTDYSFNIDKVFRGNAKEGATITVRVQGGVKNDISVNIVDGIEFSVGEKYMLFLYQPNAGGWYNTLGDYFYPADIYKQASNNNGDSIAYISQANENDNLYLGEFTEKIVELNQRLNVDESFLAKKSVDGLKANLASGFITQEEYENAIKELNEYATIVK